MTLFEDLMDPACALVLGGAAVAAGAAPFTASQDSALARLMHEAGIRPTGEAASLLRAMLGGHDGAGGIVGSSSLDDANLLDDDFYHSSFKSTEGYVGAASEAAAAVPEEAKSELPRGCLSEVALATQICSLLEPLLDVSESYVRSSSGGASGAAGGSGFHGGSGGGGGAMHESGCVLLQVPSGSRSVSAGIGARVGAPLHFGPERRPEGLRLSWGSRGAGRGAAGGVQRRRGAL
jgi:uncharacterized membrane protein YgcG